MGIRLVRTGQHEGVLTPRLCGLYLISLLTPSVQNGCKE